MAKHNEVNHLHVTKSGEEESKQLKESVPKSTVYKSQNKWSWKAFKVWEMSCVVQVPVMEFSGEFKDWTNLHKDITCMDADTLNHS